MATKIRELMMTDPIMLDSASPASEAARHMRDADVGDVLVEEDGAMVGILTDRDLAVRVMAEGSDPESVTIGSICTRDPVTCSPEDDLQDAVAAMREHHVRRVPVVEDGTAVGVLSIGDLAVTLDPDSALADISAAPPND